MEEKLVITFMRHGRSRADDEEVHEGHYDSPLTEVGRAQVRARAHEFVSQQRHFDYIVASTLLRAHESANIIGEALNVAVETDSDWQEMNSGPLAGMPFDVAAVRYPPPAFRGPYEPFFGSGESDWEVYCRAAKAVEKIVRRGVGAYLVVAHGGILNAALRTIAGAGPMSNRQGIGFGFGDAGFATMTYAPSRNLWLMRELRSE